MNQPVAIISGAARNVGKGIAKKLLQDNYVVYLLDINTDNLNTCIASLDNTQAIACPIDITDKEAVKKIIDDIYDSNQRIDVLVNNAVIRPAGTYKQNFFSIDNERFPAFNLGKYIIEEDGIAPHLFNYINDKLVKLFLERVINYTKIVNFNERIIELYFKSRQNINEPNIDDLNESSNWVDENIKTIIN